MGGCIDEWMEGWMEGWMDGNYQQKLAPVYYHSRKYSSQDWTELVFALTIEDVVINFLKI